MNSPLVIPHRILARRPLDSRGLPIPYITMIIDGKPDFKVTDMEMRMNAIRDNICGICGGELDDEIVFIGGPISCTQSFLFFDPPMHLECAEFSTKICPEIVKSPGTRITIFLFPENR